jgi:hypothetical protein
MQKTTTIADDTDADISEILRNGPETTPYVKPEVEKISMFGSHMEQENVQAFVMKMLEQRQYLDCQCFVLLNSVKKSLEYTKFQEARALCSTRIECNDDLMKVIAGDPNTMSKFDLL